MVVPREGTTEAFSSREIVSARNTSTLLRLSPSRFVLFCEPIPPYPTDKLKSLKFLKLSSIFGSSVWVVLYSAYQFEV